MSQARTNARRRRQAANGFAHLPARKRPMGKKKGLRSIAESIALERTAAARAARVAKK